MVMRKYRVMARLVTILTAAVFAVAAAAAQTPGEKQIAERIAKEYNVQVLKVAKGEEDGKPVLYVTVMNKPGNANNAFQVNTLAVDPASGDLIPQYRTTPTGQELSGAASHSPRPVSGPEMRRWSMRPAPH